MKILKKLSVKYLISFSEDLEKNIRNPFKVQKSEMKFRKFTKKIKFYGITFFFNIRVIFVYSRGVEGGGGRILTYSIAKI